MRDCRILLLRHGETLWNREGRMQGWRDSPLTLKGIAQARACGLRLRELLGPGLPGHRIVSSPLGRAWQTAVLVAETCGCDPRAIRHEPLLREISWGAWDGMTAAEIAARDPERWRQRLRSGFAEPPPDGGESPGQLYDRACRWLASLSPGTKLVAVAHGGLGRMLRAAYLGLPPEASRDMEQPQDAFYLLEHGRVARIEAAVTAMSQA